MKANFLQKTILLVVLIISIVQSGFAQEKPTYNMEFINAAQITSNNNVAAVFYVTYDHAIKKKDFRPILSMRVTYAYGDESETVLDVMKQERGNVKVNMAIYGEDVEMKNKLVYELVKGRVPLGQTKDMFLLVFYFRDADSKLDTNNKMSITYGLWEKNKPDVRVENKYKFSVQKYAGEL